MLKPVSFLIACCFLLVFFCTAIAIFLSPDPSVTAHALAIHFFDRLVDVASK